jgi:hypothetical protein
MFSRAPVQTACLALILSVFGCKSPASSASPPAPSASASAALAASAKSARAASSPGSYQVPIGPRLAILAGTGVGPIRFGATLPTIERLMEAPCEVKLPDKCRYIMQAIEFELKDGVVDRIVIHRHERPAGPDAQGKPQSYGFFNGGIPPYLGFGMIQSALTKELGPPASVEKVTTPNDFNTVERDTYPGMVLEYDRYTNGSIILGGVILTKADTNPTPAIPTGGAPSDAPKKVPPRAAPKKK